MSIAYFIVLDVAEPGFDASVNGKFVAHDAEGINAVCEELGLRTLDDFAALPDAEMLDMLPDDLDLPGVDGEPWFDSDEGIAWSARLMDHIKAKPGALRDPDGVLEDLEEYLGVFRRAKKVGARWHFGFDF